MIHWDPRGASAAYGLTDGGYNAAEISLTALGRRIVAPTREGDDQAAKREATLRPRVVRDFLTRYNGSRLPPEAIGRNVLEEIGVPTDRTAAVYSLIVESARTVGFLREVKGQIYVDLEGIALATPADAEAPVEPAAPPPHQPAIASTESAVPLAGVPGARKPNRVFITHGKNQEIVSQLKEMLTFGGFTPIVAVENETISKPVPDKVLDEMRSCDAAVIHVGAELRLLDQDGKEYRMLNQNVLIEIGAAMAFYGRKFILLVEKGVTLPSNLQGLYEVRHEGGKLHYDSTMKLLKAFNDFRSAGKTPSSPKPVTCDDSFVMGPPALATGLDRHRAYLLAVARLHLADAAAAEDVVQETLIAALAGHHAFEGRSSLRTWLTAVLRKKVVDALRTSKRTPVPLSTLAVPEERRGITRLFDETGTWSAQPNAWDDPDAALAQGEFLRVLESCLGALPPATARAFLLRELMELETPEVAAALAIKPNHLGVVLYRARMGLRECLTRNWFSVARRTL